MSDVLSREVNSATLTRGAKIPLCGQGSGSDIVVDDRVRDAANRLFEAAGAVAIVLFGSRARGTAREWSDWDLCVVIPDDAPVEKLTPYRLRPLTSDIGVPIDVVTIRQGVFRDSMNKHGTLSREIARDGAIIIGDLEVV